MTRDEYIKVCSMCTNRSFNPKKGIICGITNEQADFDLTCSDYQEDELAIKHKTLLDDNNTKVNKKTINKGRIALFVISAFYLLIGVYESFFVLGAHIIFGIIDWVIAGVFLGLAILSYKKASLSLIIGLGFYILIILLLFAIEPLTIINGIIWKVIIIAWLVYGISSARIEERKDREKPKGDDLLDQI